jgi:hypothetical protein
MTLLTRVPLRRYPCPASYQHRIAKPLGVTAPFRKPVECPCDAVAEGQRTANDDEQCRRNRVGVPGEIAHLGTVA